VVEVILEFTWNERDRPLALFWEVKVCREGEALIWDEGSTAALTFVVKYTSTEMPLPLASYTGGEGSVNVNWGFGVELLTLKWSTLTNFGIVVKTISRQHSVEKGVFVFKNASFDPSFRNVSTLWQYNS
jgi:hypothetical protein